MSGKKVTVKELIENLVNPQNVQIIDKSICGQCSKCGECCSPFLPVCQEEIDIIQRYVIENNIKPNTTMLVMQNRLQCPYFDGKKCLIYEVRPLICKEFYCNKKPTEEMAAKFRKKEYISVNLWGIAKEIENQRKDYINDRRGN